MSAIETTREWLTYAEAAALWSAHYYPISVKTLRRTHLQTKLVGRNRLISLNDLRATAEAKLSAAPTIKFATPCGNSSI